MVWNFDILLDSSHDVTCPDARKSIAGQAKKTHATTSGPACGTCTRARHFRRPELPGGGPPELRSEVHPLGLPEILARPPEDRDRASVVQTNHTTSWLCDLLFDLASAKQAVLAENPKNSPMWATPEAKQLLSVETMQFTNYDACAYAGTRKKKQALLHNMSPCSELAAVCHHTHAHDEWTPTKSTGKTKFPTAAEAEYTAAF